MEIAKYRRFTYLCILPFNISIDHSVHFSISGEIKQWCYWGNWQTKGPTQTTPKNLVDEFRLSIHYVPQDMQSHCCYQWWIITSTCNPQTQSYRKRSHRQFDEDLDRKRENVRQIKEKLPHVADKFNEGMWQSFQFNKRSLKKTSRLLSDPWVPVSVLCPGGLSTHSYVVVN